MNKRNIQKFLIQLVKTLLIFSIAVGLGFLVEAIGATRESTIMLFLLAVLFTTITTKSFLYGLFSSFLSVAMFNYFFTMPRYTFLIYSKTDSLLLFFFLITSIIAGVMMSKLQKQIKIASSNEKISQLICDVATSFLNLTEKKGVIEKAINYTYNYTGLCSKITIHGIHGKEIFKDPHCSEILFPIQLKEYPIRSATTNFGLMGIWGRINSVISDEYELVFSSIATQLSIALERDQIYIDREKISMDMEKEKLRSTLLRSVAHDLRSPLTALSGASALLADHFDSLTIEEKHNLSKDISEEIIWLTNIVENILNMTRINDSQLILHEENEVIDDIVSDAVFHMEKLFGEHNIHVSLPKEIVSLPMDGKLISQVIVNLLDNAIKHTAPDTSISLTVTTDKENAIFSIADNGSGLNASIKDNIFDNFVTTDLEITDRKRGIGLGLSICKAIVEAHGGKIFATDNVPSGTIFTFLLPLEVQNGAK